MPCRRQGDPLGSCCRRGGQWAAGGCREEGSGWSESELFRFAEGPGMGGGCRGENQMF